MALFGLTSQGTERKREGQRVQNTKRTPTIQGLIFFSTIVLLKHPQIPVILRRGREAYTQLRTTPQGASLCDCIQCNPRETGLHSHLSQTQPLYTRLELPRESVKDQDRPRPHATNSHPRTPPNQLTWSEFWANLWKYAQNCCFSISTTFAQTSCHQSQSILRLWGNGPSAIASCAPSETTRTGASNREELEGTGIGPCTRAVDTFCMFLLHAKCGLRHCLLVASFSEGFFRLHGIVCPQQDNAARLGMTMQERKKGVPLIKA